MKVIKFIRSINESNYSKILKISFLFRIKKYNKKLLIDIDQMSTTLFDLGNSFSSLYNLSQDFNNHISINKNYLLENIYVTLNNMMVDLGNSAVNQLKTVYEQMSLFFNYEDKFNYSMKEVYLYFITKIHFR